MINNPVLEALLNRKSIRKYAGKIPVDKVITTIDKSERETRK